MVIDSRYTKIFQSNNLTRQKYDELVEFATMLRDHKNIVSEHINSNLLKYIDTTKFTFLKIMRTRYKDMIPSSFDYELYTQIYTSYQNKFDAIRKRMNYPHLKEGVSSFNEAACLKVSLNVEVASPEA